MARYYCNNGRGRQGNSSNRPKKQTFTQRILNLPNDIARVEAGKKNPDSQIHEVYNKALQKNKTAKKPLYQAFARTLNSPGSNS